MEQIFGVLMLLTGFWFLILRPILAGIDVYKGQQLFKKEEQMREEEFRIVMNDHVLDKAAGPYYLTKWIQEFKNIFLLQNSTGKELCYHALQSKIKVMTRDMENVSRPKRVEIIAFLTEFDEALKLDTDALELRAEIVVSKHILNKK